MRSIFSIRPDGGAGGGAGAATGAAPIVPDGVPSGMRPEAVGRGAAAAFADGLGAGTTTCGWVAAGGCNAFSAGAVAN
jgi:hypothetical protein